MQRINIVALKGDHSGITAQRFMDPAKLKLQVSAQHTCILRKVARSRKQLERFDNASTGAQAKSRFNAVTDRASGSGA
jgi:hypothetical protein